MLHREPEYRRRVRQQRENKQRDADFQAKETAQDSRIARLETSLNAIVTWIETYTNEDSPQNKRKISREWWEIRALVAAAAVGAVAIIVGSGDASDTRREMQIEGRPWIGLSGINPRTAPGKPDEIADFMIVLSNGGREPAFNAKVRITGGPGDCDQVVIPRTPCDKSTCVFDGLMMMPNTPFGRAIPYAAKLCVVARVDYTDAAGKPHKTGICFIHTKELNAGCTIPDSNYAD
jgi:hypothetical protein